MAGCDGRLLQGCPGAAHRLRMGAHCVQILRRIGRLPLGPLAVKALTQRIAHQQPQPPNAPFSFQRIGDQINRLHEALDSHGRAAGVLLARIHAAALVVICATAAPLKLLWRPKTGVLGCAAAPPVRFAPLRHCPMSPKGHEGVGLASGAEAQSFPATGCCATAPVICQWRSPVAQGRTRLMLRLRQAS